MMHQNELRGHSGNERQNEDGSVTGSGNRNTDRSERSEF